MSSLNMHGRITPMVVTKAGSIDQIPLDEVKPGIPALQESLGMLW